MSVAVLISVGGNDSHRTNALDLVRSYYATLFASWTVVLVAGADRNKGAALNDAVADLDEDVIVLNDADSLVPPHQLWQTTAMADKRPGLVFAYTRYRRIDRTTSKTIGPHWSRVFSVTDEQVEWQRLDSGSHGCVAIQRSCWEQVGGLDPAFKTDGYEDLAFNTVCEAFWPSRRVAGDLFHLWHPRGWDATPEAEARNRARYGRYLEAWGDREQLLALRRESDVHV